MDLDAYIAQLEGLLGEARSVPMSASVMVNKRDVDDVLMRMKSEVPEELRQARWIIKERDDVLAEAQREVDAMMEDTRAEQERLLSETEVVRASQRESERILADAREQARILRLEAEDYVDSKLANFEIVLTKTLTAVERGREKLRGRMPADELAPADDAVEEHAEVDDDAQTPLYDYDAEPQ